MRVYNFDLSFRKVCFFSRDQDSLTHFFVLFSGCSGNPDAKRLYDDLLSNYNKLVRPVINVTDALTVKIKLKLSQLIDVVRGDIIRRYLLRDDNIRLFTQNQKVITRRVDFKILTRNVRTLRIRSHNYFFAEFEESDHDNEPLGRTGNILIIGFYY